METQQLTTMLWKTSQRIDKATQVIHDMAREKAETEYAYRLALGQEITKLKAESLPVTLIADVSRSNVAELKLKRDLAEGKYKASIESLKALQTEISALQSVARYQSEIGE